MEHNKSMWAHSRARSFAYALAGLKELFRQEPNAKLHAVATVVVIAAGIVKHINTTQWLAVIFAIGLVWITEALNTCIERLCDLTCGGEWHPTIKVIKDISAGAVLIAAMISVAIGILVFFL